MKNVLVKEGNLDRGTPRKDKVKTQEEDGHLQIEECWQLPEARKLGTDPSPGPLERVSPNGTLVLDSWLSEL